MEKNQTQRFGDTIFGFMIVYNFSWHYMISRLTSKTEFANILDPSSKNWRYNWERFKQLIKHKIKHFFKKYQCNYIR